MYEYTLTFSADLREVAPEVGGALRHLDDALATCGIGKLGVRGNVLVMTMQAPRILTRKEAATMKTAALEVLNERFPSWQIQVSSMRRKSRKSRNQSNST